jgi:hypothetical protein
LWTSWYRNPEQTSYCAQQQQQQQQKQQHLLMLGARCNDFIQQRLLLSVRRKLIREVQICGKFSKRGFTRHGESMNILPTALYLQGTVTIH